MHFWILLCAILSGSYGAHHTITDANWVGVGQSNSFGGTNAYAVDRSGNLYACGNYGGGIFCSSITKWDHKKWSDFAGNIDVSKVIALLCDNKGDLYAGGEFDTAGGIVVNHIAKWDGAA
jgi:hypothetical protein